MSPTRMDSLASGAFRFCEPCLVARVCMYVCTYVHFLCPASGRAYPAPWCLFLFFFFRSFFLSSIPLDSESRRRGSSILFSSSSSVYAQTFFLNTGPRARPPSPPLGLCGDSCGQNGGNFKSSWCDHRHVFGGAKPCCWVRARGRGRISAPREMNEREPGERGRGRGEILLAARSLQMGHFSSL